MTLPIGIQSIHVFLNDIICFTQTFPQLIANFFKVKSASKNNEKFKQSIAI